MLLQTSPTPTATRTHGPWAQRFHLMPQAGWLNDPNGLCQKDGTFHAYFQNSPDQVDGGLKHWGHATSRDLVRWEPDGVVLSPDTPYDAQGVYSGSAQVHDGRIWAFYTGNVKHASHEVAFDYVTSGRDANVLLATSDDGSHFGPKQLLLTPADYPAHLTCHVRDPKVFASPYAQGPAYLMLLGARAKGLDRAHDRGELLVFGSEDLTRWRLENQIVSPEPMGYMWECPDFLGLGTTSATSAENRCPQKEPLNLLSVSPQGLEGPEAGSNVYPSGYMAFAGSLVGAHELGRFHLWDGGFDFYAPQTFTAQDGRCILIGWMGMPDCPQHRNPTVSCGWQHCFTVPREVVTDGAQVFQRPAREFYDYRSSLWLGDGSLQVSGVPCFDLEIARIVDSQCSVTVAGGLTVSYDQTSHEIVVSFEDRLAESLGGGRGERRLAAPALTSLRILGDASSVEVFCNGGAQVFSSRYYPRSYSVQASAPKAAIRCWQLDV